MFAEPERSQAGQQLRSARRLHDCPNFNRCSHSALIRAAGTGVSRATVGRGTPLDPLDVRVRASLSTVVIGNKEERESVDACWTTQLNSRI